MEKAADIISKQDLVILRDLAKTQMEVASLPVMQERTREWFLHNDLKGKRPMIHLELWTFGDEIIPDKMRCEGEKAREIESSLLQSFLNYELFDDDRIVPPFYPLQIHVGFKLFNADIKRDHVADSKGRQIGHKFEYLIDDLEKDSQKLDQTQWFTDLDRTYQEKAFLEELFGDILPVRIIGRGAGISLTQHVVHLMGMEAMFMAMYDCPDALHALMKRITDDYMAWYQFLESQKLILPTNTYTQVAQGTWAFTHELPGPDLTQLIQKAPVDSVKLDQIWGYMDSQETVGLSPEMFEDFFFPYYKRAGDLFGLLSYGCCEPVDSIWDTCVSQFKNLRKVSISPWCDEEKMGERLRGSSVIFHRKPSPNFLGVGYHFDADGFSEHIRKTMLAARGCKLEITMRDVYSLGGDPGKARRAVAIIRQLTETVWQA